MSAYILLRIRVNTIETFYMSDTSMPTNRCAYCGNNPVSHRITYLSQTCAAYVGALKGRRNLNAFERFVQKQEDWVVRGCFLFFRICGLGYFTPEAKPISDRSRVIWDEAVRRGKRIEQAWFFRKPSEHYRVHDGKRWHYFMSIPFPLTYLQPGTWMDSKALLKEFFLEKRVMIPRGGRARNLGEALTIFDAVSKPVILKPEIGSRGRHTITHIYTKEELETYFPIAQTLCKYVVVEEHLHGSVYRATYVNGDVVGVLRGDPPRITGNGVSTISELIHDKNETKHERQKAFVVRDATHAFLGRQGYMLDTVLPLGTTIDLIEKIGLSYGGFAAEDFHYAHPKLLQVLREAGDLLKLPIVGFDFISEDITQDPDTVRWGIIESNTLPFIDLHHFPVEGEPINVAAKVWDMWEEKR